jgi:beta-alanine--pyruvate transaminase
VRALAAAGRSGTSYGAPSPLEHQLAERVRELVPSMELVRLVSSGTEAAMSAIRVARGATGRDLLVKFDGCYHGHADSLLVKAGSGGATFGIPDSKGVPAALAELTLTVGFNDLEAVRELFRHRGDHIAAVIVEPVAGSTGVILPPKGYLERLREICTKHGILLIFDEVITGFGRLGTPFAADYFGVTPDIMTTAKGVSNGVIPMGAVFVKKEIHDAFMTGPEHMIEFFHGYTYSGNPIACAAALGTLDTYKEEGLLTRGEELAPYWEDALHSLKGEPNVIDIRNIGLIGAIELAPIPGSPTKRAFSAFVKAFERGALIRTTGDIIALSPPLIITKGQINELIDHVREVLRAVD